MGKPKKKWASKYLSDELKNSESSITSSSNIESNTSDSNLSDEYHFEKQNVYILPETSLQISDNPEIVTNITPDRPFPVRPVPTYNCGRDLSTGIAEFDPLRPVPTFNNGRHLVERRVDPKLAEWPNFYSPFHPPVNHNVTEYKTKECEARQRQQLSPWEPTNIPYNFDAIHYVTNHLSNIEITRIQAIENNSNEDSNSCNSNSFPSGDSTSNELIQSTKNQKNNYVQDVTPVNATINSISPKSKSITKEKKPRIRRGKPLIPPDLRPILNSSGIDEKVASDFIVDSPIDSFRENISKLPAGPEVKDRLKEARRQGKNRNAAKKSRQNQMARMSQLRERHKSLTKQLSDIKYIEKKIQELKKKYLKYSQMHFDWCHYARNGMTRYEKQSVESHPNREVIKANNGQYNAMNRQPFLI